jgi:glycerol-3-phosphate dehydrogenase (NAD(P)+)
MMKTHPKQIAIVGAGAWGTSLGLALQRAGHRISMICETLLQVQKIHQNRTHPTLYHIEIHSEIQIQHTLQSDLDYLVLAIPAQSVRSYVQYLLHNHFPSSVPILLASKGIDQASGQPLSGVCSQVLANPIFVLSGPNFATEVAQDLPTISVIAGEDPILLDQLSEDLSSPHFVCFRSRDPIGIQVCGSYKNVLAMATGMMEGLGYGMNAQAALLTFGLQDMETLVRYYQGELQTILGPAGIGDTVLTAFGEASRNRRFGVAIGKGMTVNEWSDQVGELVEGYLTLEALNRIPNFSELCPFSEQLFQILYHNHPIQNLWDWVVKSANRQPESIV